MLMFISYMIFAIFFICFGLLVLYANREKLK